MSEVNYLIGWLASHPLSILILILVFVAAVYSIKLTLDHGLRVFLILVIAWGAFLCIVTSVFALFSMASEITGYAPDFLCEKFEYCSPGINSDSGSGGGNTNPNDKPLDGYLFEVSDPTGATLRDGPSGSATQIGTVPEGTDICIKVWQPADSIGGCAYRGQVISGGQWTQPGWVHCSAMLISKPIKPCP